MFHLIQSSFLCQHTRYTKIFIRSKTQHCAKKGEKSTNWLVKCFLIVIRFRRPLVERVENILSHPRLSSSQPRAHSHLFTHTKCLISFWVNFEFRCRRFGLRFHILCRLTEKFPRDFQSANFPIFLSCCWTLNTTSEAKWSGNWE